MTAQLCSANARTQFTQSIYKVAIWTGASALVAAYDNDPTISLGPSPALSGALFGATFAITGKCVSLILDKIFDDSAEGRVLKAAIRAFAACSAGIAMLSLTGITLTIEATGFFILKTLAIVLIFEICVKGLCFENA